MTAKKQGQGDADTPCLLLSAQRLLSGFFMGGLPDFEEKLGDGTFFGFWVATAERVIRSLRLSWTDPA